MPASSGLVYYRLNSAMLLACLLYLAHTSLAATPLSEYTWQNRPLLLFAPTPDDTRLQQTQHKLQQRRCELEDRQIIIGEFITQGQNRLHKQPVSDTAASRLRERFGIEPDQFTVILIGKDGGNKYRLDEVPDLDGIYALIDGMPMRQNEMAQNPVDCDNQ